MKPLAILQKTLTRIINVFNTWHYARPAIITGDVAPNITISAAHVAAESFYSAVCNKFPTFRSLPACRFNRLRKYTEIIMQFTIQNQIKPTSIADIISTNNYFWSDISLFSLRVRAIEGLLPDCLCKRLRGSRLTPSPRFNGHVGMHCYCYTAW